MLSNTEFVKPVSYRDELKYILVPNKNSASRPYWIGQTPATVAAYRRFAQAAKRDMPGGQEGEDHPVVNVSWQDAKDYCQWAGGRLPKEDEWEHAARAGGKIDPYGPLDEVAWHTGNSNGSTHGVAQLKPNDWGLYDTLGNVWEWCEELYESGSKYRVGRGGSWNYNHESVRASFRNGFVPGLRYSGIGFRCVRDFT